MDGLLPTFVAALLAEIGDKTQLLAALLAVRYRRNGAVLGGLALAALANSLIAAFGGRLIAELVNFRAISLMVALALLAAGAGGLFRQKPPLDGSPGRLGPFAASAIAMFVLEFGDKTQFLTLTLAARADSLWLAACGAAAGMLVAAVPAVALGDKLRTTLPIGRARTGVALLFLLVGLVVAVGALRLI